MKHTSVRLSDKHAARIAESGKSPTYIIKKALDLYFDLPSPEDRAIDEAIQRHVKQWHNKTISDDAPHYLSQNTVRNVPIFAHEETTDIQCKKKRLVADTLAIRRLKHLWNETPRPSIAAIGKAIGYPKSTVADAIKRLKENNELF
jgi:hypothetical protein